MNILQFGGNEAWAKRKDCGCTCVQLGGSWVYIACLVHEKMYAGVFSCIEENESGCLREAEMTDDVRDVSWQYVKCSCSKCQLAALHPGTEEGVVDGPF
jgi:hypothetical protein